MNWFALATLSALLSASAAILQKKILFRLHAIEFSFLVSLVILVASCVVPFTADITAVPLPTLLLLLAKSVLGAIAFLCVMMALEHNQISSALPLLGLTPGAAALLSMAVLGESLKGLEWAGIALMMAGTYALEARPNQRFTEPFRRILITRSYYYIFAAVALFAVSSVADRLLVSSHKVPPPIVLFYQHVVYCGVFGIQMVLRKHSARATLRKGAASLVPIIIVALLTLAYRYTQLEATKLASVALVLAVKRTSILYAALFGGLFFSEERLSVKMIAGICIVASGFLILREIG